jgi:hypothetical protein
LHRQRKNFGFMTRLVIYIPRVVKDGGLISQKVRKIMSQ